MYRRALGMMALVAVVAAGGSAPAQVISAQDKVFVMQAASGGMTEVEAGQLVETNAQQQLVKDFAQKMVAAHSAANQELMALAQSKGITPPDAPLPKDAAGLKKLEALTSTRFDAAYIHAQVGGHQAMERVMEKEILSGSDPDLKAFAEKNLPVVHEHLQMARELDLTINGPS